MSWPDEVPDDLVAEHPDAGQVVAATRRIRPRIDWSALALAAGSHAAVLVGGIALGQSLFA